MAEQEPGFEVSETAKQISSEELQVLLPEEETSEAPIYNAWRSEYIEHVGAVAVKAPARRASAQKRTPPRRK